MPRDDIESDDAETGEERADRSSDAAPAVLAARSDGEEPDTTELRELATAAEYAVVGEVTQRRREDPTYWLGRGAAEDLMRLAAETGAAAVICDGGLSPGQTFSLGDLLPTGTAVIDRPRLVLDLFADEADSRAAVVQLELARLRYELPRLRETVARDSGESVRLRPEGDGRVRDLERRIDSAERDLDQIVEDGARRRDERRTAGFDHVALAGYTNAGKSTLARRLADDVGEAAAAAGDDHPDRDAGPTATGDAGLTATGDAGLTATDDAGLTATDDAGPATADRLFQTVSTTTRRATLGGRRAVVTDTVGFLDGIPHESIRSFRATLEAVRRADCVLLAVDASDAPTVIERKLRASLSAIEATDGPVIPVLTKADRIGPDGLTEAVDALEATAADIGSDAVPVAASLRPPVTVDARGGSDLERLANAVGDALPTATDELRVANRGETQAALSWAYDRGVVERIEYGGEAVSVALAGRPDVVAEAARRLTRADDRSA